MRRGLVLVLVGLAACGDGDRGDTQAVAATTICPFDRKPQFDYMEPYPGETQSPALGLGKYLATVGAFSELSDELNGVGYNFDPLAAAHAGETADWVVATDISYNTAIATPAADGGYPTAYRIESHDGLEWGRFVLAETSPGVWWVQEAEGFCHEIDETGLVRQSAPACPVRPPGTFDYLEPPEGYEPQYPPTGLAHELARNRILPSMQAALAVAEPGFLDAVAANAGTGHEWIVAKDSFGNQVVAGPATGTEIPTTYFLESPAGDVWGRYVMGELAPDLWAVMDLTHVCVVAPAS